MFRLLTVSALVALAMSASGASPCGRGTVEDKDGTCIATGTVKAGEHTIEMSVAGATLTLASEGCTPSTSPPTAMPTQDPDYDTDFEYHDETPDNCPGAKIVGIQKYPEALALSGGDTVPVFVRGAGFPGADIYTCNWRYQGDKFADVETKGEVETFSSDAFAVKCPTPNLTPEQIKAASVTATIGIREAGNDLCVASTQTVKAVKFVTEAPRVVSDFSDTTTFEAGKRAGGPGEISFDFEVIDTDSHPHETKIKLNSSDEAVVNTSTLNAALEQVTGADGKKQPKWTISVPVVFPSFVKNESDINFCINAELKDQHALQAANIASHKFCFTLIVFLPRASCKVYHDEGYRDSGVYLIMPPKWGKYDGKPFKVYCEMKQDGGGWTLLEYMGGNNRKREDAVHDKEKNADAMANNKQNSQIGTGDKKTAGYNDGSLGTVGRDKFNAVWNANKFNTVLKVGWTATRKKNEPRNKGHNNGCIDWFYKKNKYNAGEDDFDVWLAIRDTKLWSSDTTGGSGNYKHKTGEYYSMSYTNRCTDENTKWFNPKTNAVANRVDSMSSWEPRGPFNGFMTSRHGIPGDANSGCTWEFSFSSSKSYATCSGGVGRGVIFRWLR